MTPGSIDNQPWPAPAKLNLFLHITGRRADGYHELQSLFQLLDWGDEVFIRPTHDGEIIRTHADYDVPASDDIAIRAARRLKEYAGASDGAGIRVDKNIPMGAGLGGGSSNAATVLLVLNRLWGCGLAVGELASIGLELGADVPVFVHGHSAMATGVGEFLEPVQIGERHYVLVMPDIPVSTAAVFSDPELVRDSAPITIAEALAGGGHNDCEPVTRRLFPELSQVFDDLSPYGQPRMSGTGSAVFVQVPTREAASGAASKLKCRYNVRAVGGLDRSPLREI